MIRSLYSAISGLQQFQEQMDVISNNVANVNTTAFKSARTDFSDSFSQTLKQSSPGSGGASSTAAMQIGSGVATAAIKNIYTQGALSRTGVNTDLAIAGEGFFMVRNISTNALYATRAGDFRVDQQGYLITNTGERVQGYSTPADVAANAAPTGVNDIQIDSTGMPSTSDPTAKLVSWQVDTSGQVNVNLSDGTQFVRGQVLLQNFKDPQALVKEGGNLYSGITAAGPLGGTPKPGSVPGSGAVGIIQSGALELSNVDLANEFANLIITQRAFQANGRIITTSDEMLQDVVNLKH